MGGAFAHRGDQPSQHGLPGQQDLPGKKLPVGRAEQHRRGHLIGPGLPVQPDGEGEPVRPSEVAVPVAATSSPSPGCPGWPARCATSPRPPRSWPAWIDLVVLKQGIDTTTPAGRFTFHVLAAMDEMLADLISEGTREGLESARARGRVGGRKPKLTTRQADVARGMYDEAGADGRRKYTVAEIAETFGVSRKTVYRHLEPSAGRRQTGKSVRPGRTRRAAGHAAGPGPRPRQRASRQTAGPPRCRAGPPGLPGLRARTRHQRRGAAATRGPRHRLAAPRRRPPHRGQALRGMPAARARHRRQLLLLRQRPPDHRAATRSRRPTRAASAGLAAAGNFTPNRYALTITDSRQL